MRKIFTALVIAGAMLTTACNTIVGASKDVASVGGAAVKALP
jgi:predicted small secreted protein